MPLEIEAEIPALPYSKSDAEPNSEVRRRLDRFRTDLRASEAIEVVRKHLTLGRSYILSQDDEYRIKSAVGAHFQIHPDAVKIVGSAQLGFSIAPQKRYKPFHEKSDIDLAVISDTAFDRIWLSAQEFKIKEGNWDNISGFRKYLMSGWIRPDMLPRSDAFPLTNEWFEMMGGLATTIRGGAFKISAGLYRNHAFLEMYQRGAVQSCKELGELET